MGQPVQEPVRDKPNNIDYMELDVDTQVLDYEEELNFTDYDTDDSDSTVVNTITGLNHIVNSITAFLNDRPSEFMRPIFHNSTYDVSFSGSNYNLVNDKETKTYYQVKLDLNEQRTSRVNVNPPGPS